jgi:hypothetical protein
MPGETRKDDKQFVDVKTIKGDDSVLHAKAQAALRYYEEEKGRVRTIEGKAAMFLKSSGFLGTVLIGTSNILLGQENGPMGLKILMTVCLFFFTFYMVITIVYSIKALHRGVYSRPDPVTILEIENGGDYDKQAIVDLLNSTIYNQNSANSKMDNVVLAQRYFLRLMLSLLMFVLILLLYVLQQNGLSVLPVFRAIKEEVGTWPISMWFMFISSTVIIGSLVLGIVSLVRVSRLKKVSQNDLV